MQSTTLDTRAAQGSRNNLIAMALVAMLAIAPWFAGEFVQHLAVLTCLNVVAVTGLALISRSGQLSLGHAAFMAIGAYCAALAGNLAGLSFIPALLLGFAFSTRPTFYALALAVAILSTWGLYRLFRQPLGQAIDSVAVNPALAEATGLSVHRIQICCFVAGCAIAAVAGILQSRYIGYISPESFNTSISVGLIIMLVIGGRNSSWGPLVGAIVLTPLPELFRGAVQTQHIFYGAAQRQLQGEPRRDRRPDRPERCG